LPSNCPADYDNWFNDWSDKWVNEVPFFSNPLTEIKESILMNTCPPPSHVSTTTRTRTPWVSALKDVSIILNQFFTSAMEQEEASPSSTSSLLRTKNQPKLLASADTASGKSNSPNPQPNPQNRNARLLAEGENPPLGLEITPEITPIGPNRFSVCWTLVGRQYDKNYNYCDWGYAVAVKVAGQEVGGFNEPMLGGHCFEWNPTITCTMGSARPIEVTAPNKDDIEVVVWITTGRCTGASCATIDPRTYLGSGLAAGAGVSLCLPPKVPDFVSPEGNEDPVTSEGHTLLKGKDEVIGCDAWSGTGNDFQCISPNKTLENDVKDPVWAEIKYPFLYTIYDNLSGPTNGLFVKLFKPNKIEANDWDYTAESRITYCLEDHPAPSMIKGGSLQIDKRIFYSPTARCETPLYTREIRAFPSYIGGVYNAKEWVKNEVLQPIIF
jgi:hypothetical protein